MVIPFFLTLNWALGAGGNDNLYYYCHCSLGMPTINEKKMMKERKINREIEKGPLMIEIRPSFWCVFFFLLFISFIFWVFKTSWAWFPKEWYNTNEHKINKIFFKTLLIQGNKNTFQLQLLSIATKQTKITPNDIPCNTQTPKTQYELQI